MRPFTAAVLIKDEDICDWRNFDVQLIVNSPSPNAHQSAPLGQSMIDSAE